MFVEMANPRQVPGDKPRKIFFTGEMELIVWYTDRTWAEVYGFQLCFGGFTIDHVITALPGQSVSFHKIDEGRRLDASVLKSNGAWLATRFWDRYQAELQSLPSEIWGVVEPRLRELDQ